MSSLKHAVALLTVRRTRDQKVAGSIPSTTEPWTGVPLMVRRLKKSSGPGSVSVINLVDPLSGCKIVESGDYIPSLYS